MKSPFVFFVLFSFVLLGSNTEARKDPGEYWQGVMKDQLMPEAIQGLIHEGSVLPLSNKKTNCHTEKTNNDQLADDHNGNAEKKPFVKDFEPRPNVSVYHDGTKLTEDESFVKGFDSTPSATIDQGDGGLKGEKSFVKDFEPRPNVSVYHDGTKLTEEKSFVKDFDSTPSATIYHGDGGLKGEKSFVKDFEPRPNVSVYQD
ncbi:hypothetical protein F0562_020590 [Nyssa sinensis]|uniref:Organ-specific protein S2 n=1 Tax=Nyssa sinensis TaxID=561372 RepID=A0A5J5BSR7_9ASTE|nr:hypothetical protein F0562_020590 [Nyssa sinensis]